MNLGDGGAAAESSALTRGDEPDRTARWLRNARAAYEALAHGDALQLLSLLADDVEWRGRRNGVLKKRVITFGRVAAFDQLGQLLAAAEEAIPGSWLITRVQHRAGRLAVGLTWRTADKVSVEAAHLLRLGNSHITEVECHRTYEHALASLNDEHGS